MATAVHKIILSSSRDIPFNKLVLSQSNVRRVKAGVSIEELAEDIARRTLLQSLNVRPVLDAEGAETGMFEIPAGGRRYRALELLVKQKRLAKTAPVPCVVRDPGTDILGEDDSLAENIQRAPLHPLDQFRAFQALREKGRSEEDIAAAFFVGVNVVKQRLRLASVSPTLLDVYAEDGMSLEQLMAFTVTSDHARQEQVWQAISGSWQKEPYQIRRMLTEKTVRASDRRAVFVGLDAYEAAGGVVLRDLFQSDDGGWLEDVALLDGLFAEKLKIEAEKIAAEGWKWIEVAIDFPYGHTRWLRVLEGIAADLSPEEQATIEALNAEYAKLEAEYDGADELPDEVDERLGEIETALAAFDDRPATFEPADIARAGVFVSVDSEGALSVDRGYVRPEDEAPIVEPGQEGDDETGAASPDGVEPGAPVIQRAVITIGGQVSEPEDEDDDVVKPLPDRLVTELTAERTLALRDKLATTPSVAFQAVLHKFCLDVFSRYFSSGSAMEVTVRSVTFPIQAQGLKDTPTVKAISERHKSWEERLPKDRTDLWDWLTTLTGDDQAALFAHCASFGVNALYEKADRYGAGISSHGVEQRIGEADRIARAVGLDMVEAGWRPTVENYLGRVPKRRILEAVREGAGERAAQLIDHLKKGDMAKEAERLLADTGWLPESLRMGDADAPVDTTETEADGEALPEFLVGDDEEADTDEAETTQMIAAE
ncbi:MAG: ParB N-terminal domain-containing protein [Pseudomonadota bacterium]|jgi:ParB family chromosome partitioning protein|uniref:ParB/RepB/Spo0J family partition protein n=1 Tax=Hyphomonas sp. TaxID=87 RepID=UPI0017E3D464|nr:ParB/RepB/Spo0J family partition protein [Hyphomonas sp.]MBA3068062.1 DNA-binding protein [Hyphomonas sp.]MBU3920747.1 ParB N-terminal domain-containing protein [Alphaproteobacteria bacterium]MBU4061401.1 ParB N-terminal domain-containing protein [Alphaproteobacteria bacterium]MBU4162654.1 ParB N-terminal domain-containing protein [Alphaproteobacteria bacterium]